MKTYKKRIAFLISDQHFIPHGGIGQFAKGFTELCNNLSWKVDFILDKEPSDNEFKKLIQNLGGNIIFAPKASSTKTPGVVEIKAESALPYDDHVATFAFSDSVNLEKIINFRKSLTQAFSKNLYDVVVCNSQESMSAAYIMGLTKMIAVVFYTHLHSMIFRQGNGSDVFLECYHEFFNKHMEFPDVFIGTQTLKNKMELENNRSKFVNVLPMPITEQGLLTASTGERKGVLFIGRWEEGKNPEAYIKVMKECGLPCKVMTSKTSAKTFEKKFKENNITDYEIRVGITGQEKVDFIKSAMVHFNTSLRESYGLAFMECLGHMPCVVLEDQEWTDNFESIYYFKTSLEDAASLITMLYSEFNAKKHYKTGALPYVRMLHNNAIKAWEDFVNGYEGRQSNSNVAEINKHTTIKYKKYISNLKRKPHIAREDFESVLTNRHKFTVIYTDSNTWLSKDETYVPSEEEDGEDDPRAMFGLGE